MVKKRIYILLSGLMIALMAGCGNTVAEGAQTNALTQETIKSERTAEESYKMMETESRETAELSVETSQEEPTEKKTLVVYFSATGTTKPLAEYAAEFLNADLYEIVPEDPYTEADLAYYTNGRADQEQNDASARPKISGHVEHMENYETIVLGYPIWHGQAPRIISTFLESYDFSEKQIIPFCTSHSSGIGNSAENLHSLCPESVKWADGKRFAADSTKEMMEEWLGNIKY